MKKTTKLTLLALLAAAHSAQAALITVTNGDFENWEADWTRAGSVGWQPVGTTTGYTDDLTPYGGWLVFGNGAGTVSQTLTGTTLQTNTTYTLTVAVGNRNDLALPGFGIELLAGASIVASEYSITQGGSVADPADGTWSDVTATFTTGGTVVAGDLGIVLQSYGVQVNYDNVSLDATAIPEPGTYALLAGCFALASVMIRRRR